ncbi:MAG: NAD-dependent epimerase/dehydratase family protein [Flavobacteriia bacterium]|nr:NAD-dependent epimerase/dehydratase family protein [Flavobacteriia bacterium]
MENHLKALVTGGAGFIGSNLVDRLIDENFQVSVIDDLSSGKAENINPKADFYQLDLTCQENESTILSALEGSKYVFHLAALPRVQPSIEQPQIYHDANVNATLRMLELSKKSKVKRFIFTSSSAVYGDTEELPTSESADLNPLSPYGLHKLIGDQYCKLFSSIYELETVCLRYFNVFGERMPMEGDYSLVMAVFAKQIMDKKPMTIRGDGEQKRDFVYVGDVARANILAALSDKVGAGEVFNIGSGQNRSVNQIAELMKGDSINVDPVIEPRETLCNNQKAQKLLNWQPTVQIEDWIPLWRAKLNES